MAKSSSIYTQVEPEIKEVDVEIQKGLEDLEAGRIISATQVRKTVESLRSAWLEK